MDFTVDGTVDWQSARLSSCPQHHNIYTGIYIPLYIYKFRTALAIFSLPVALVTVGARTGSLQSVSRVFFLFVLSLPRPWVWRSCHLDTT